MRAATGLPCSAAIAIAIDPARRNHRLLLSLTDFAASSPSLGIIRPPLLLLLLRLVSGLVVVVVVVVVLLLLLLLLLSVHEIGHHPALSLDVDWTSPFDCVI